MENKAFFNIVRPRPRSFFSRPISKCITWLVGWVYWWWRRESKNRWRRSRNIEGELSLMGNKKEMSQQEVTFLCNVNCTPNRLFLLFFGCQSIFMGNSNENGDSPTRNSESIKNIFSSCSFSHLFKMHLQLFFYSQCLKYQKWSHLSETKQNVRVFQTMSAVYSHFVRDFSCLFTTLMWISVVCLQL